VTRKLVHAWLFSAVRNVRRKMLSISEMVFFMFIGFI